MERNIFVKMSLRDDMTKGTQNIKKSLGSVNRSAKQTGRSITQLQRSVVNFGMSLAGVFGIGLTAKSFIDVASSFEQMEKKLDALTKGRGKETLEELNKWALEMPVNTRKAIDTFAMMQAMGLDPTIEKMEILVDVASIFGQETMPRVARALGQMKTLGKLSAEELNQLSEAGINARKYLTEAFGMGVEKLKKSQISIDQIIKAIMDGLDRDFGGSARRNMDSWQGLTAATVSYVEEIQRKLMDAGIFEEIKDGLSGVNTELNNWIDNNNKLIKQRVPEYIADVKKSISDFYSFYKTLPDGVVGATGIGFVGRILFGPVIGSVLAGITFASVQIDNLAGKMRTMARISEKDKPRSILGWFFGTDEADAVAAVQEKQDYLDQFKDLRSKIEKILGHKLEKPPVDPSIYTPPTQVPTVDEKQWSKAFKRHEKQVKAINKAWIKYNIDVKKTMDAITLQSLPKQERAVERINQKYKEWHAKVDELYKGNEKLEKWAERMHKQLSDRMKEDLNKIKVLTSYTESFQKGIKKYGDEIGDMYDDVADAVAGSFRTMEDALVNFVATGKLEFNELTKSILLDFARINIRQSLLKPLAEYMYGGEGGSKAPAKIDKPGWMDWLGKAGDILKRWTSQPAGAAGAGGYVVGQSGILGGIGLGGGGGTAAGAGAAAGASGGWLANITDWISGLFADGGRPRPGWPAIVGERGPELFIPDRAGTIVSNKELGGTVNKTTNNNYINISVQAPEGRLSRQTMGQLQSKVTSALQRANRRLS